MRSDHSVRIINAFWELVRGSLWNRAPDLSFFEGLEINEWHAIYDLVVKQAVVGICFSTIEKLPAGLRPPRTLFFSWFARVEIIRSNNCRMRNVLSELKTRFEEEGIYPVLMKGVGFASWYTDPDLRMTGDIDLYIPERYKEVVALVKSWGYELTYSPQHDKFEFEGISVELHHHLINPPSEKINSAPKAYTTDQRIDVRIPQEGMNALLLLTHACRHLIGAGIGIRHLCDWALFLHKNRETLDLEALNRQIELIGMSRFVVEFTALAVHYLKLDIVITSSWMEKTEKQYEQLLFQDILENGDCGRKMFERRRLVTDVSGYGKLLSGWISYYGSSLSRLFRLYPFWSSYIRQIFLSRIGIRIIRVFQGQPFATR